MCLTISACFLMLMGLNQSTQRKPSQARTWNPHRLFFLNCLSSHTRLLYSKFNPFFAYHLVYFLSFYPFRFCFVVHFPSSLFSLPLYCEHTADGDGPLSPLRDQKVCPLPLRLCVMEHSKKETVEKEQMGGGHTGCPFYNITPNNAVAIGTTV